MDETTNIMRILSADAAIQLFNWR